MMRKSRSLWVAIAFWLLYIGVTSAQHVPCRTCVEPLLPTPHAMGLQSGAIVCTDVYNMHRYAVAVRLLEHNTRLALLAAGICRVDAVEGKGAPPRRVIVLHGVTERYYEERGLQHVALLPNAELVWTEMKQLVPLTGE